MEEKEAKEDQGVRDACQVYRVLEMVSIHALIPSTFVLSSQTSDMNAMMFTEVVRAEYAGGYRVRLWFNNETVKTVDLEQSLKGSVFEPLKDVERFKRFQVKYATIEWENGADLAPEYLFELPAVE